MGITWEVINMSKAKELSGERFGKLIAIERSGSDKKGNALWICQCDCENLTISRTYKLTSGEKNSCGCLQKELISKTAKIHGLYGTRIHTIWRHMKERCDVETCADYKNYGGRGIRYCEEWKDLLNFKNYSSELTLDRIDVNGNYEPRNCRWASHKIQANNTRVNRVIEISGVKKTMTEWSDETGVKVGTIWWRIENGYTGEDLIYKGRLNRR